MKLSLFQKMLLYIGLVFILVVFILLGLKGNSLFQFNSFFGYDIIQSIQYYVFEKPIKDGTEFLTSYANYERSSHELRLLEEEISKIARIKEEMKQIKKENEELQALLDMRHTMTDYESKTANIISRDEAGWHNYLTIDLGSLDGVETNQAVVNHEGLIGKIYHVSDHTSIVKLITAEDGLSKVSLKIVQETNIEAMLERYDANLMYFEVTALDANTEIAVDSAVITSGLGGVFPNGILVGRVSEVVSANNRLGKIVYVKPAADFSDINYVSIVQRKVMSND